MESKMFSSSSIPGQIYKKDMYLLRKPSISCSHEMHIVSVVLNMCIADIGYFTSLCSRYLKKSSFAFQHEWGSSGLLLQCKTGWYFCLRSKVNKTQSLEWIPLPCSLGKLLIGQRCPLSMHRAQQSNTHGDWIPADFIATSAQ